MGLRGSRSLAMVFAVLLLAGLSPVGAWAQGPSQHTYSPHSYSGPAGSRDYLLFVPDRAGPLPLVVFLHGCLAAPTAYGLDRFAQAKGFAVAYPIQPVTANPDRCWNWYRDQDRHRGAGEPAIIAGITAEVMAHNDIDPARVFIAGHSSGSGMAAVLADAYPDLYAAAGLVAGCGQSTCADVTGYTAYREMGPFARAVPAYIAWGTADNTNPYVTGRLQLAQWLATNDLADNGLPDLSMPRLPAAVDLRLAAGSVPTFTIEHYRDARRCGDVDFATGVGMGHIPDFGWPAIFPAMTDFLLAHPRRAC